MDEGFPSNSSIQHLQPEHLVQFYATDEFLINSLCGFATAGLTAGETVIYFGTPEHRNSLNYLLRQTGFDVLALQSSRQWITQDAADALSNCVVDGNPQPALMAQQLAPLLELPRSQGRRVRVIGETAAVLWNQGRHDAAIRLEELGNTCGDGYSFSLLCVYPLQPFANQSQDALDRVCGLHTCIAAEGFAGLRRERLPASASRQTQVRALQVEVARRSEAEGHLRSVKEELETQIEDLRRIHDMSVRLTQTLDIDHVLNEVLRASLAVQGTDMGLLSLSSSERIGLTPRVSSGFSDEFLKVVEWIQPGAAACGACYAERRRIIVENVDTDPAFVLYRDIALAGGFRSCHSTPLITRRGSLIGVLTVCFRYPHRPAEREIRLMDLYARMASDFIENAQLHNQVQQELVHREQLLLREQVARSEAEDANRMKDAFLATVSHELRTPLNNIIGWCYALRKGMLQEDTRTRALETIDRNAKVQAQLIEDILDVSRVVSGKLRLNVGRVDLSTAIHAAVDSVQHAAMSRGIELRVTLDPSARHTLGDSGRLQQIIWNLLSNAIKFTPSGGSVEVRLKRVANDAEVSVIDTGEGISSDFLPFVFDCFRQADAATTRRHGGLGLGLAIVRYLAELHGGTVSVSSAGKGCGSQFTIRIPLLAVGESTNDRFRDDRARSNNLESASASDSLKGLNVLVVDDDGDTLSMLAEVLSSRGADVRCAGSAAEALDVLRRYEPDVLVSDLAMPDEDGYSLIAKVRALEASGRKPVHAVALTALVRVEDRARALSAGFNMFVPKPIEPGELIPVIANRI